MKYLEKVNTEVIATSAIYYDKPNIEKLINTFSSLNIIDFRLSNFIEIITAINSSGGFDRLPKDPEQRKTKNIELIKTRIDSISDSKTRDRISSWFNNACEQEYDIELQNELLYRYVWAEYLDRVLVEDASSSSFKEKLSIKPFIPDLEEKQIKPLCDIDIPDEQEEDDEIYDTGIYGLDDIVKMRKTNFVVIAARTTIGKSLFMINQAVNLSSKGTKILYASLEESNVELKKRVLLHLGSERKTERAKSVLNNFHIFTPNNSAPTAILNEITTYITENQINVVFIDYIQLMKYSGMSDWDSLRALTRELKLFAVKNNILLVTASQLKREAELTGSNLTALYGSSTLEADANIIIVLEPVRKQNTRIDNTANININIMKNRSGAQGKVENILIDYSCGHIEES